MKPPYIGIYHSDDNCLWLDIPEPIKKEYLSVIDHLSDAYYNQMENYKDDLSVYNNRPHPLVQLNSGWIHGQRYEEGKDFEFGWLVKTSSYQGESEHHFKSEKEAEKKYIEWSHWDGNCMAKTEKQKQICIPIKQSEKKDDWYCPKCQAYISGEQVTFEETHATCGAIVYVPKSQLTEQPQQGEKKDGVLIPVKVMIDTLMERYNDDRYSIQRRSCYYDLAKDLENNNSLLSEKLQSQLTEQPPVFTLKDMIDCFEMGSSFGDGENWAMDKERYFLEKFNIKL